MPKQIIVIPIYKQTYQMIEQISLCQCLSILKKYDKCFVCSDIFIIPKCIQKIILDYNIKVKRFNSYFFKSKSYYSSLCLSKKFYNAFKEYEYMLIYQLDAFVFKDELDYWVKLDYDYIGAPWCHKCKYSSLYPNKCKFGSTINLNYVGNGGFSLRKINTIIEVLDRINLNNVSELEKNFEDTFFANSQYIKKPPCYIACKFSAETIGNNYIKQNIPFGSHNLFHYSDIFMSFIQSNIEKYNMFIEKYFK